MGTRIRPVLTKLDFVRRYEAGEFGNASPTWNTLQDWICDPTPRNGKLYHVRNRVTGARTWYNLNAGDVPKAWCDASGDYGDSNLYISEMAPTHLTLLQGEVRQSERHLDLRYTTVRKPMRDALREEERHAQGIIAVEILRSRLCSNSYDWLTYLLELYPEHIIEFSTYGTYWGTVPFYNTVYWEVRMY